MKPSSLDWIVTKIKKEKPFVFLICLILTLGLVWISPSATFIGFHESEKIFYAKPFDAKTFDRTNNSSAIIQKRPDTSGSGSGISSNI